MGAETAMTMVLALPDMLAFRCKCQEKIAVFTLVLQAEYSFFFLVKILQCIRNQRLVGYCFLLLNAKVFCADTWSLNIAP